MPVKHEFHSPRTDGDDDGVVQPSSWNADHSLDGMLAVLDAVAPTPNVIFTLNGEGNAHLLPIGTYAPLNSPQFTGVPLAPTPDAAVNTNQVATMAALHTAIANLQAAAPSTLDTLNEIAAALGNDANFSATITAALGFRLRFDATQTLSGGQKAQAVSNLGLAAVAVSGAYGDLSGRPTFGIAAGNAVQLDGSARLPAVDGSQLTNLPATGRPIGATIWVNQSSPLANTLVEDGASYSSTTYAALFAALVKYSVATMTIAAPGVATWNAHGRKANDPIKFTTTGALPTGLTAGTTYYVVGASITTNTFQVSATPGGVAITTTGSQSGTHTAINAPHGCANDRSTFNVPNTLGEFIRGWDGGRGVDADRAFGSGQLDAMQGHVHAQSSTLSVPGGIGAGSNYGFGTPTNTGTPISDGTNGTPRLATETRPRSVAKLPCIYYQ